MNLWKMCTRAHGVLALALLVGLVSPAARADDCATMLYNYFNGGASYGLGISMVTSRSDNRYSSYTSGVLSRTAGTNYFRGTNARQLFSDRYTQDCSSGFCLNVQPFSVNYPDSLSFDVWNNGYVTIYNNTWGGSFSFYATCSSGFLYGISGGAMYVIALNPLAAPPR